MKKQKVIRVVALVLTLILAGPPMLGFWKANYDALFSTPELCFSGYPTDETIYFHQVLREWYGVHSRSFCVVVQDTWYPSYDEVYETVALFWIEAKHGKGALERAWREAEQRNERHAPLF